MRLSLFLVVLALVAMVLASEPAIAESAAPTASTLPWWAWVLLLFVVTFLLEVVAVVAGVGGGVLFVPIVSGLFPFHLDFVRGTGLLIALAGALAAGPTLLRSGMANLQLAMPPALTASAAAIVGAMIGLILPDRIVQLALGTMILGVVGLMIIARKSDNPEVICHLPSRWYLPVFGSLRWGDPTPRICGQWSRHAGRYRSPDSPAPDP